MSTSRVVEGIDEQVLLNSIADKSCFTDEYLNSLITDKKQNVANVETVQTASIETDVSSEQTAVSEQTEIKRVRAKQRKADLGEFKQQFMQAPKIENPKPVFISLAVRDSLDRIARLLGERGLSVSGLVENLTRNFLETYKEDVEQWRKM